jgi:hypothetical protein
VRLGLPAQRRNVRIQRCYWPFHHSAVSLRCPTNRRGCQIQSRTSNSFITASVFQINGTNVLVADSSFNEHQDEEVRSRGVELEVVASLSHGLRTGEYCCLDAPCIRLLHRRFGSRIEQWFLCIAKLAVTQLAYSTVVQQANQIQRTSGIPRGRASVRRMLMATTMGKKVRDLGIITTALPCHAATIACRGQFLGRASKSLS